MLNFIRSTLDKLRERFAHNLKWSILVPTRTFVLANTGDTPVYPLSELNDRLASSDAAGRAKETVEIKGQPISIQAEFSQWLEASASEVPTDLEGIEKMLARADAMYQVGKDRAAQVMEVDLLAYKCVWESLRLDHSDEILDLKQACKEAKKLCPAERKSLRQPLFGQTSAMLGNDVYLDELYEACELHGGAFDALVSALAHGVEGARFHAAPSLKLQHRALEKTALKYEGDLGQIRDVKRNKVTCEDLPTMTAFVRAVMAAAAAATDGFGLASIKNKIVESFPADVASGGYRDVNINVFMPGAKALIGEVQIHLKAFDDAQARQRHMSVGGQSGHDRYAIFRRINERLAFQKSRMDRATGKGTAHSKGSGRGGEKGGQENDASGLREEVVKLRTEVGELKQAMAEQSMMMRQMMALLKERSG